jgi:signal recognition particle receptor subunit beta
VLNYTGGEVNAKIVYYGPGLSGKTTNLEFIHDRTPEGSRGKMVSMKTQTDRTLFFDFLPLELGEINGYRTRFLLYTVPGQVYYNATRKLVLKGVDAVVFVADSSRAKLDENLESLRNLEQNLNEHGMSLDEIPWVIQYNKRDASDAMALPDLDARLNPLRVPSFEAVATMGKGVYETFHGIATLVYRVLKERLERGDLAPAPAPAPAAPHPAPPVATRREPAATPASADGDYDIDSMLREMDAPASKPLPRSAPVPPAQRAPEPAQRTVNPSPSPRVAPASTQPVQVATHAQPAAPGKSLADSGEFERSPESFDMELGRLPSLDDAAFASENARHEGPNEFVTDPMRRAAPPEKPAPKAPAAPVAPPQRAVEVHLEDEVPVAARVGEAVVTVPVTVSRAQLQPGVPLRVVLEIRVKDE